MAMAMTNECYLEVAAKALEDQRMIKLVNTLGKGICNRMSDDIITNDQKEEIWAAATTIQAMGLFKKALKTSKYPGKMAVFFEALDESQKDNADDIRRIHQEYIDAHRCYRCQEERGAPAPETMYN